MSATLSPPACAPERSYQQRMQALQRGNEVRHCRMLLKRDLKAGRQSASALLADPPDWLASMKVVDLLVATPKWGRVKAMKALNAAAIAPIKTVGGITERQRMALVVALTPSACPRCGGSGQVTTGGAGEGWR